MLQVAWRGFLLAGVVASCGPTISIFSPIADEQATSLKVDALTLMEALKQAGLGLVRVDQFRSSLIDLVIGTAFKVFL